MHLFSILHVKFAIFPLLLYFPVLNFALRLLSEVRAARSELQKLSPPIIKASFHARLNSVRYTLHNMSNYTQYAGMGIL